MSILRYGTPLSALLITKGHPFPRDPLFQAFESFPDIAVTGVEQPAAQAFFEPKLASEWDAFVFYDMPGIEFLPQGGARFHDPPQSHRDHFLALLEAGHGFVFLHHAIAGWPTWPEYAEILGGRFHYAPAELRGEKYPDSGYRLGVTHRVSVVADHPVVEGLDESFEIEDELYLCPIFEDDVEPLLRSDATFEADEFLSSGQAITGKMFSREGWSHPPGSNLVGWTKRYGRSPIVYLALGDGPSAYEHPAFRKLVGNAIRWVSAEAKRLRGDRS
jgi:type 1 glutamine amidotransferase